jgi:glycosyltransferase involved in cell wall biosynthesis
MRFAKPVIASDIPGAGSGWLVREAGHGLLIPPGEVQALVEALRTLGGDTELRRYLGQQGRFALADKFDIDRVTKAIETIYDQALSTKPPSVPATNPRQA